MKILTPDDLLNKITMYRTVLYGLFIISATAFVLSVFKVLPFTPLQLTCSLAVILVTSFVTHITLRKLFHVSTAYESWLISALILFLILQPSTTKAGLSVLALGSVLTVASKYVLTYRDHHIFNPVAIALVVLGLLGSGEIFWWVGSTALLPIVLLVGLAVARKTRKLMLSIICMVIIFITFALTATDNSANNAVQALILSGPLIFFVTIMFSEPLTTPGTKHAQYVYAVLVGVLYGMQFKLGPVQPSAELALVAGNLVTLALKPGRYKLILDNFHTQGSGVYEFVFKPNRRLQHKPGQYIEVTIPHKPVDSRGNRRFFSIVSSPAEDLFRLAVRVDPNHNSSFKRALFGLTKDDVVWAAHIAGNFTLPKNTSKPIVMIAGGVGITPFQSMVKDMVDSGQKRNVTLLYCADIPTAFGYVTELEKAKPLGVTTHCILTSKEIPESWTGQTGPIDVAKLQQLCPDLRNSLVYVSGPPGMVKQLRKTTIKAGAKRHKIKTDYFTGY